MQALELYQQIEDRYSRSRNLIDFTSAVQLKLAQSDAAIESLTRGAELADGTEFEFYREAALEKIQQIQNEQKSTGAE